MRRLGRVALGALLVGYVLPAVADGLPGASRVIGTDKGPVQGLVEDRIASYKGMPYAAPPLGALRFKAPQQADAWTAIYDATGFGAPAMQSYERELNGSELSIQLATVFTMRTEMKVDNEDCLYLNVWTPALDEVGAAKKRPVMVWFHGGGFAYGSGAWPVYDGTNLARKGDVVVVTVNHRLNVFGYLHLGDLEGGAGYADAGNAGMLDLIASLEWVKRNIGAFGGDPGNVTIMGESGGGAKVSTLLAMPEAAGLFHKAVIQSGPGLTAVPAENATRSARAVLEELGVEETDLDALADLSTEAIVRGYEAAQARSGGGFMGLRMAPVVDGRHLPRHPFTPAAPDQAKEIPVLIGFNKDEWTIFNTAEPWFGQLTDSELPERAAAIAGDKAPALLAAERGHHPDYSPTYLFNVLMSDARMLIGSTTLAERKAAQGGAPVYVYYLTWETPVGDGIFKTPHTLDMPFMFNNVDKSLALTGDSDAARTLENQMSSAWIAFARTGDPGNEALPDWPAYDAVNRPTMVFDVVPKVVNDPKGDVRAILADGD